jgi:hypothetical protein
MLGAFSELRSMTEKFKVGDRVGSRCLCQPALLVSMAQLSALVKEMGGFPSNIYIYIYIDYENSLDTVPYLGCNC